MRSALYVVDSPTAGRLATMAHPRGGDWLAGEMTALADAGVNLLVSALTDDELAESGLVGEAAAARAAGLDFIRYPIQDVSLPPSFPSELALTARLADEVRAGRFVVVHCWAGIGRSSMLVGAVLVRLGAEPADAWELIRQARGRSVPDSTPQERWLYDFAEILRS